MVSLLQGPQEIPRQIENAHCATSRQIGELDDSVEAVVQDPRGITRAG